MSCLPVLHVPLPCCPQPSPCRWSWLAAQPASAATTRPDGRITSAVQHRDGSVSVTGWAYDRAHPSASTTVCLAVHGKCVRSARAVLTSAKLDRSRRIAGKHRLPVLLPKRAVGVVLTLRTLGGTHLDVRHVASPAGACRLRGPAVRRQGPLRRGRRVAAGRASTAPATPSWVYAHAGVANLPHNAEAQRQIRFMHRIPRAKARPGDLVFYFSGGPAYHVAIYAGHGKQYAAATPRDGIRYQPIWSSNVEFRTDWH